MLQYHGTLHAAFATPPPHAADYMGACYCNLCYSSLQQSLLVYSFFNQKGTGIFAECYTRMEKGNKCATRLETWTDIFEKYTMHERVHPYPPQS
jgi:hypothetical protein